MRIKILLLAFAMATLFIIAQTGYAAVWPISNSLAIDQITSDYGPRIANGKPGFHWGIDLRARTPQPLHAIKGGTIITIKINDPTAGNFVEISGIRYLHLSKSYGSYEIRESEEGPAYIVFKNGNGVTIKVYAKDSGIKFTIKGTEIKEPIESTNALSEGELFSYSGSSGLSDPKEAHLHIDKGQPGQNPLRDLPYTHVPSTVTIVAPSKTQVSGKVRVVAGVESCQPSGGACSGNSVPDLNEVRMSIGGVTVYNPKFDSRNADAGKPYIHLPGEPLRKGIFPVEVGKEPMEWVRPDRMRGPS